MATLPSQTQTLATSPTLATRSPRTAFAVVTALFFMWGFLTCLNDIMIPHLKGIFELNYAQAMMVQFCFFSAYFVVSIPAGRLIDRLGYKTGMILGLAVAALGTLLFQPAATFGNFSWFLAGFFILASGITILQVAANPYVSVLGAPERASSRLNLSQAFNSLGTTLAPLFGSALILQATLHATSASEKALAVRGPYLFLTLALLALAAAIGFLKLPEIDSAAHAETSTHDSLWNYPALTFGAVAIFAYVGGEVSVGSFLVNTLALPEIAGMDHAQAGHWVALYWGGAMVGRFVGSYLLTRMNPARLLGFHALGVCALLAVTILGSGSVAMFSVLSIGLLNSIMFPTIFALAIEGLGPLTARGSGILCAAIVGGAIVPLMQGFASDAWGVQAGFFVPLLCYGVVAAFARTRARSAA